jgi:hypothetical protein
MLTAMALALGACGGDDDGGPSATAGDSGAGRNDEQVDACSLLTQEEAAEALGSNIEPGEANDFKPFFGCRWAVEGTADYVDVTVLTGSTSELEYYYDLTDETESIDGYGDKAQWAEAFGAFEVLTEDYDVTVGVGVLNREPAEAKEIAMGLMEKVLARLED